MTTTGSLVEASAFCVSLPEEQPAHTAAPVRAHDDPVAAVVLRRLDDRVGGETPLPRRRCPWRGLRHVSQHCARAPTVGWNQDVLEHVVLLHSSLSIAGRIGAASAFRPIPGARDADPDRLTFRMPFVERWRPIQGSISPRRTHTPRSTQRSTSSPLLTYSPIG